MVGDDTPQELVRKPPKRVTPALLGVLQYLVDHDGSGHAYAIMVASKTRHSSVVPAMLRRLRECGWTTSRTADPQRGAARVVHTLTAEGEERARAILAAHRQQAGDSQAA